jgi:hypothetical protein
VIGLPPLLAGGLNATDTDPKPPVAVPMTGLPGRVAGTNVPDGVDAGPVPTPFVAVTVQVYDAPLVSGPTTIGLEGPSSTSFPPPFEEIHVAS